MLKVNGHHLKTFYEGWMAELIASIELNQYMTNEHATCRANDIKRKRLLGGNPTQKEKENQICFLFPLSFIFCILLCFWHSLIFIYFISTLRTMLCLKCGVLR